MLITLLFLLLLTCVCGSGKDDPYRILGVKRNAPQEDIRRRYRELCLRYHPDKNVHRSSDEQRQCVSTFKQLQNANSLIGDEKKRKEYDYSSQFSNVLQSGYPNTNFQFNEKSFTTSRHFSFGGGRTPVFVFSVPTSGVSRDFIHPSLKSIFVQRVKVPLETLYSGRKKENLVLKTDLWSRLRASFRGGVAYLLVYQTILYSLPFIRWGGKLTTVFGACIFHLLLPMPSKTSFSARIRPGYKQGTKLIFHRPGYDAVFVLYEDKHPKYHREANNLHVSHVLSPRQARRGCTIEIEPLGKDEPAIEVEIPANQTTVVVKGRGWPIRRKAPGSKGDLIVHILIQERKRERPT
jgi:DnaJ-class molecular chaperone